MTRTVEVLEAALEEAMNWLFHLVRVFMPFAFCLTDGSGSDVMGSREALQCQLFASEAN